MIDILINLQSKVYHFLFECERFLFLLYKKASFDCCFIDVNHNHTIFQRSNKTKSRKNGFFFFSSHFLSFHMLYVLIALSSFQASIYISHKNSITIIQPSISISFCFRETWISWFKTIHSIILIKIIKTFRRSTSYYTAREGIWTQKKWNENERKIQEYDDQFISYGS